MHEHPASDATDAGDAPGAPDASDPAASVERAARFLDKVRLFAAGLDADERELLAALLGPGIELAHRARPPGSTRRSRAGMHAGDEPDTFGFDHTGSDDAIAADDTSATWTRSVLPSYLADTLRSRGADVTGPATSWPTES